MKLTWWKFAKRMKFYSFKAASPFFQAQRNSIMRVGVGCIFHKCENAFALFVFSKKKHCISLSLSFPAFTCSRVCREATLLRPLKANPCYQVKTFHQNNFFILETDRTFTLSPYSVEEFNEQKVGTSCSSRRHHLGKLTSIAAVSEARGDATHGAGEHWCDVQNARGIQMTRNGHYQSLQLAGPRRIFPEFDLQFRTHFRLVGSIFAPIWNFIALKMVFNAHEERNPFKEDFLQIVRVLAIHFSWINCFCCRRIDFSTCEEKVDKCTQDQNTFDKNWKRWKKTLSEVFQCGSRCTQQCCILRLFHEALRIQRPAPFSDSERGRCFQWHWSTSVSEDAQKQMNSPPHN